MTERNTRRGKSNRRGNGRGRVVQLGSKKRGKTAKNRRNIHVMHRWLALGVVLIACILLLVKCAGSVGNKPGITKSTVQFSKKGEVTVTSIEPFDKDYYSKDELQTEIDTELGAYNSNHDGEITCKSLKVEDQVATLVMKYKTADDYVNFNEQKMFFGSLQAAEDAGYDLYVLSGRHNNKNDGETFAEGTAEKLKKNKVVVITEKLDVISERDILYYTDNFVSDGENKVTVTDEVSEDHPGILILE